MNKTRMLAILLLIPALLLAACSGVSLGLTAPSLAGPAAARPAPAPTAAAAPQGLAALQSTFEQIYIDVNPSVVNIQVAGSQGLQSGLGSGFAWDQAGHIVTNAHVVDGAGEIRVTFSDGSSLSAELVGADPYSDLAVLRVAGAGERLKPVRLADSRQVKVGQLAIAIGNPFGLQGTMTQGIISGLARSLPVDASTALSQAGGRYSIPDIIQTDAAINPGNSGGVLVDGQGQVIGVTAAIATSTQTNSGVGFVIPTAIVQKVVPALIADGRVEHSWMGISGTSLTPELAQAAGLAEDRQGALVISVTAGSPAEKAGLRGGSRPASSTGQQVAAGGDVIIAIDGQSVKRFEDMVSYLYNSTDPGDRVTLTVLRQGRQQNIQLTLGALPDAD